jgi:hypothetical protein
VSRAPRRHQNTHAGSHGGPIEQEAGHVGDERAATDHRRRRLLKGVVGGLTATGLIGVGARLQTHGPRGGLPQFALAAADEAGVQALEVPLGDELLPLVGRQVWQTLRLPTSTHSMVGFTWRGGTEPPTIEVSSRRAGDWSSWREAPLLRHAPSARSPEQRQSGTELSWIGSASGVQVRVRGRRPASLTLVLLHPARRLADENEEREPWRSSPAAPAQQPGVLPRPAMRSRRQWGADETWRDGPVRVEDTLVQIHVHHTANSNDYAELDVPALLRGMYRYHTKNLGWSDLAYNFLIDQFGTVWQGRAGGAARLVRGAHTLGFNSHSCGIAVIGNFELVAPSAAVKKALVGLAAWKLDAYGLDPMGTAQVVSEGSDKFAPGRSVELPVIDGHRDTNETACPGENLYAALPGIRSRTRRRIDRFRSPAPAISIVAPASLAGVTQVGQALTVTPGTYDPADSTLSYQWLRDGQAITGAAGAAYTLVAEDVGRALSVRLEVSRSGYSGIAEELAATSRVTAVPAVAVEAVGKRGRGVIHINVAVTGWAQPIGGPAWVRIGDRVQRVDIEDGRGKVRFSRLPAGRHEVTVRYRGDGPIEPASGTASLRVRRRLAG